jgi:molecular chaperone DnaK (HSP70)
MTTLLDVSPLTFGMETNGSVSTTFIKHGTGVAIGKCLIFSTAADS